MYELMEWCSVDTAKVKTLTETDTEEESFEDRLTQGAGWSTGRFHHEFMGLLRDIFDREFSIQKCMVTTF